MRGARTAVGTLVGRAGAGLGVAELVGRTFNLALTSDAFTGSDVTHLIGPTRDGAVDRATWLYTAADARLSGGAQRFVFGRFVGPFITIIVDAVADLGRAREASRAAFTWIVLTIFARATVRHGRVAAPREAVTVLVVALVLLEVAIVVLAVPTNLYAIRARHFVRFAITVVVDEIAAHIRRHGARARVDAMTIATDQTGRARGLRIERRANGRLCAGSIDAHERIGAGIGFALADHAVDFA
jgi:hypothetical protein